MRSGRDAGPRLAIGCDPSNGECNAGNRHHAVEYLLPLQNNKIRLLRTKISARQQQFAK